MVKSTLGEYLELLEYGTPNEAALMSNEEIKHYLIKYSEGEKLRPACNVRDVRTLNIGQLKNATHVICLKLSYTYTLIHLKEREKNSKVNR